MLGKAFGGRDGWVVTNLTCGLIEVCNGHPLVAATGVFVDDLRGPARDFTQDGECLIHGYSDAATKVVKTSGGSVGDCLQRAPSAVVDEGVRSNRAAVPEDVNLPVVEKC